ncbi:hypothetical protein JXA34_03430 [Patescibacteria group bacterium]|nr:hypothetical protein [Patescibacteria group bacterium]
MEKTNYPWYGIVSSDSKIEQGDFLESCPVIVPTSRIEPGSIPAVAKEFDVVVMSQSCDISARKIQTVLVCPVWTLAELGRKNTFLRGTEGKESLRQGHIVGYHILDKCPIKDYEADFKVVDFRAIFGIALERIEEIAKLKPNRLRLLPPYREHLSQAFARFFMRVGLPVDIPEFKKEKS